MKNLKPPYYIFYIVKLLIGIILISYGIFLDFSDIFSFPNMLKILILFLGIKATVSSIRNLYKPNVKKVSKKIKEFQRERKLELILTLIFLAISLFIFATKFNYSATILFAALLPVIAGETLVFMISILLRTKLNIGFLTIFLSILIWYWQIIYMNLIAKIITFIYKKIFPRSNT